MAYFEIFKKVDGLKARTGVVHTAHGDILTPAFLPIGTQGTVKSVTSEELKFWGASIILANTYHLWQRPGDALIYKAGGLHRFMNWQGPIFTDSGGFQIQSLSKLRKITEAGVVFRSHLDGGELFLSPEKSVQIQANLGSDIAMILDDFSGLPFQRENSEAAVRQTRVWAERSLHEHKRTLQDGDPINPGQKLWGIVQGANFQDLRAQSAKDMTELGFEAFAIGGVATVDEPFEDMMRAVAWSIENLPEAAPKHLLGVGTPYDIVQSVARGCDTFDCVIPTREARHGRLYVAAQADLSQGYKTLDIRLAKHKEDFTPIDPACNCYACLNHTRGYVRHLFQTGEPLGIRLATMHNLRFYLNLMEKIRIAIQYDYFQDMVESFKNYTGAESGSK